MKIFLFSLLALGFLIILVLGIGISSPLRTLLLFYIARWYYSWEEQILLRLRVFACILFYIFAKLWPSKVANLDIFAMPIISTLYVFTMFTVESRNNELWKEPINCSLNRELEFVILREVFHMAKSKGQYILFVIPGSSSYLGFVISRFHYI